ncbi:asparagine synthase (glutamine-hydrolyzing) [Bradyrhizobium sp. STM 3557]|uniref:asparagine synthase (glutamine-hydrolyzing) n=1 Tax=Bradyrhizobium sp. STM 3557 TaxID=578920 RepID=UPI0038900702
MCGIAGLLRPGGGDDRILGGIVRDMTDSLAHRGPDASGIWTQAAPGIAFGHRRLSILDLSDAGAQPMRSDCGRFVVTFNGEIYNHLELRAELETAGAAPRWRGHSDTETLLAAIRHWGVIGALQRASGMFAIALWDERERTLTLCRDRFGEKPLYYGWSGADLLFASELKAFATHPAWTRSLDRAALTSFMRFAYVPAPASIWSGVRKVPPGCIVTFPSTAAIGSLPEPAAYWSLRDDVIAAQTARITSEAEAIDELQRLLLAAIKRQCLSDVPLGAFLSGGIDSSTVVALMQVQASRPVRTFSIGFREGAFDEAADAAQVAAHLGTDHTELYIEPETARDVIPLLPGMYDEPFADSSQIPTHLVSQLARRQVTVALSGDGGDELFGGYNRHVWGGHIAAVPAGLRAAMSLVLGTLSPARADAIASLAQPLLPERLNVRRAGDQMAKLSRVIGARSTEELYLRLCSIDDDPSTTVVAGEEQKSWASRQMAGISGPLDPLDRMTLADSLSYLTDDVLQKVDRAAMAVALETRVPFLDRDVVQFAAKVPPAMKIRDRRGKWLVRQVLHRHVPQQLVDRPKTGFGIPLDAWLRGPLKGWTLDLLSPARLKSQGLFDAAIVEGRVREHMIGVRNHGHWLWNVLMAQAWLDAWSVESRSMVRKIA